MTPIPLKRWLAEEAQREHVTPHAIYERLRRGKYPWVSTRHDNQRVVYVIQSIDWMGLGACTEGVRP